jgi:hypothetical protein
MFLKEQNVLWMIFPSLQSDAKLRHQGVFI